MVTNGYQTDENPAPQKYGKVEIPERRRSIMSSRLAEDATCYGVGVQVSVQGLLLLSLQTLYNLSRFIYLKTQPLWGSSRVGSSFATVVSPETRAVMPLKETPSYFPTFGKA